MKKKEFTRDWQGVDALEQPAPYVTYLEIAQENPQFKQVRAEICKALEGIQQGGVGVDVGCGLGLAAHELAGQGWQVTGIDFNKTMIDEAGKHYPDMDFRVGSALNMPFGDRSLDFYRSERVYVNLPKQEIAPALAEAYRTLKPGGIIVLAEPDLETIVFPCSEANRSLAQAAVKGIMDAHHNSNAGTNIRGQLISAGFAEVKVVGLAQIFTDLRLANQMVLDVALEAALSKGYLSQEQIEQLRLDLIEHGERDAFQLSCTAFIVSARRP